MNSAINWQAIATIAAALLVVAAGAIGYLVRGREERRSILSVSLFHLFEIWDPLRLLSQWQPADLVEVMFAEIKEQIPSLEIPESEKTDAARIINIIWPHRIPPNCRTFRQRYTTHKISFMGTFYKISKKICDPCRCTSASRCGCERLGICA